MSQKFGAGLSGSQMNLARQIERAGLASVSQAVKAIQRAAEGDSGYKATLADWRAQLAAKQVANA